MRLRTTPLTDVHRELRTHASRVNAALDLIENGFSYVILKPLSAEPSPMYADMVVNADGTNWDPGSGAGHYRRDSANTTWVFIG